MNESMFPELDTPSLVIEKSVLENNLKSMQDLCHKSGVKLRPHIKTHKSLKLAKMQIETGAVGIACAKLSEAEVFSTAGIKDIQIANIIVGEHKYKKLLELVKITPYFSVCVDTIENTKPLNNFLNNHNVKLKVNILIDCGYHRCGMSDFEKILSLASYIDNSGNLILNGITTHAGQAYTALSKQELYDISIHEATFMSELSDFLKSNGIKFKEIIIGSNPTSRISSQQPGITEIRTGNYIFNDMIQVGLGSVDISDCALTVLAQVISVPSNDRVIIDAGSKTFSSDKGGQGNETLSGYGKILNKNAVIERLSEEHGIITHSNESFVVGERLRIIPNHACTATNMFKTAYVVDGGKILEQISIDAQGKIQ